MEMIINVMIYNSQQHQIELSFQTYNCQKLGFINNQRQTVGTLNLTIFCKWYNKGRFRKDGNNDEKSGNR